MLVVNKLNMSFNVAALKARLNSFGSLASVRAINEFVTHVPIFAPIIIGTALFTSGIIPAPTIITAIDVVAVAFCIKAVSKIPIDRAAKGFDRMNFIISPACSAYLDTSVKPIDMKLRESRNKYSSIKNMINFITDVNMNLVFSCFV